MNLKLRDYSKENMSWGNIAHNQNVWLWAHHKLHKRKMKNEKKNYAACEKLKCMLCVRQKNFTQINKRKQRSHSEQVNDK